MRLVLAATLALATTPALADALTYAGTVDGVPVLVELAWVGDSPVGGRYTYLEQGGDIPLDPAASPDGMIYLAEQAPCRETDCVPNDDNVVDMPPRAATWGLSIENGTAALVGVRHLEGEKVKTPNVELVQIGRRPLGPSEEATPFALHDRSAALGFDHSMPFTRESAPYEYALFNIEYDVGVVITSADGSEYFYATDPRTKFAFPRVGMLSDGSDTAVINDKLAELHSRMSLSALDCLAFRFAAWGQSNNFYGWGGHLGDYDYETVTVSYLSPRLISWTQAGSLYCTGAHPYNHYDIYNYDVRTGEPVDLRAIFSAWVPREYGAAPDEIADTDLAYENPDAYFWGPSPELIAFVRERMPLDELFEDDAELLDACASEQALADMMRVRFEGNDQAVFAISGAPHVIGVCNGDLVTVPIGELAGFLAPKAADFFPSLNP